MRDYPSYSRSSWESTQPPNILSCSHLMPWRQHWAPTREILVEAQISDPWAFHFSLPSKFLLVVPEGNFEPAETGTWLPRDLLGYANVWFHSGLCRFSVNSVLVPLFLWISLWRKKLNLSVDAWFWSCLEWCCTAVHPDLELYLLKA